MIVKLHDDIIEIIVKSGTLQTYPNLRLLNHEFYNILNHSSIYYHFAKQLFQKKYNRIVKPPSRKKSVINIVYCSNTTCPNKLHQYKDEVYATSLTDQDLSPELMLEYRDILRTFRNQNTRFDKTMTNLYPDICKICNIHEVPYCEDCLVKFLPEIYKHLHNNSNKLVEYIDIDFDYWIIAD